MRSFLLFALLFAVTLCFADSGFGVSDAFTMDMVNPLVTVTNPTLGQEILNGDTLPITWTSEESNIPPNCINLSWRPDPATDWALIAQNQPNSEFYEWPVNHAGTNEAQVRVWMRDAFGNLGFGVSEPFVILPPEEPQPLTITSTPSGAQVYISGTAIGLTPYSTTIAPGDTLIVSVQKVNYSFSPASLLVLWINEPQTIHFTGTYTGTGTVVTPGDIPDVWVLAQSPYLIPDPIVITSDRNITMQQGVQVINQNPAPIPVFGSLNATGVTFKTEADTLFWGGIQIIGSDSTRTISQLTGCLILNAFNPLLIRNSNPLVDSLQINPADTLMAILNPGILIEGNSAPMLNNVIVTNYETGIRISATEPQLRDTPSLTNVRIRSTGSSVREPVFPEEADPQGIEIEGCSSAVLNDVEITEYLTGISATNDSLLTEANPSLTNVRIRSTSSSVRTPSTGIVISGFNNSQLNDIEIGGCNYGVKIAGSDPVLTANPSLTNVRIRSTNSSVRDLSVGIIAGDFSSPEIKSCEIYEAEIGIQSLPTSHPEIKKNTLRNCNTALSLSSTQFLPIRENLLNVEQNWLTEHPGVSFTGIEITGNPDCTLNNNTFCGYAKVLLLANSSCLFENNIAWHYGLMAAPFQRINSSLTANYNDVRANSAAYTGIIAANNLNSNPLFRNLGENNFYLQYNSPCVDAGNPATSLNQDGTRTDMGAYPYLHKADFTIPEGSLEAGENLTFINTSIGHNEPVTIVRWDLDNDGSIDSGNRDWTASFPAGTYNLKLTMITGNLVDHSPLRQFQVQDVTGLAVPANLQAVFQDGQIRISWDLVGGAQSYLVLASDDPQDGFVALGSGAGTFTPNGSRMVWTTFPGALSKRFYRIVASSQP